MLIRGSRLVPAGVNTFKGMKEAQNAEDNDMQFPGDRRGICIYVDVSWWPHFTVMVWLMQSAGLTVVPKGVINSFGIPRLSGYDHVLL